MKESTTVRPLTERQYIQELKITEREYIKKGYQSFIKKINDWEKTRNTDNYKGNYTKQIEKQIGRFVNLKNSVDKYENYDDISLEVLNKFKEEAEDIIKYESALNALVLKAKKEDFQKNEYPGFLESEAVGYLSMKSEHFPQFHYVNRAKIDSLHKEIIGQREIGEFPEKTIDEHGELVKKSYTELEHHICKLDKNSDEFKGLNIQYNKAIEIGGKGKGESPKRPDHSRPINGATRPVRGLNCSINGATPSDYKSLPPLEKPPYDFLFYGTIAVLTLLAGRYISRQLNTQTKEKPVEEKFNIKELKKISPLFGNENIKIENQNVYFNNFSKELYEKIKNFFPDSHKNIKARINQKGLTLILSKNLSAKEGNKVFSKFLEQFKDDFVNEFKDIFERQDAKKNLTSEQEKNEAEDKKNPGSNPVTPNATATVKDVRSPG
jgi:hypothetical protein